MSPPTDTGLPVGRTGIRHACCAVASHSQAEVQLVHSLLENEFSEILEVASEADWQEFVQRNDVAVLLLAFNDLAAARNFLQRYAQQGQAAMSRKAQVIMLCSREDVDAAYDMCRSNRIFDYVMFWPVTHDPRRLTLAAHRACDAFEKLPRRIAHSDSGRTPSATNPDVAQPIHDLDVLVVEDHDFQLAVVVSVLISAGLRATGVSSAHAALAILETSNPGLILLDVDMPDMNGLELLRLLKATPRHAGIPVIMLTITREREMVLEALRDGAADFIVKPFDRDTLLQKIRRVAVIPPSRK